jgi:hypothetical protein
MDKVLHNRMFELALALAAAAELFAASAVDRYPDAARGEVRTEMGRVLGLAYVCVQEFGDGESPTDLQALAVGGILGIPKH